MDEKKLELAEDQLEEVAGGCEDHDPNYYAATPPCVRCGYKYMQVGKLFFIGNQNGIKLDGLVTGRNTKYLEPTESGVISAMDVDQAKELLELFDHSQETSYFDALKIGSLTLAVMVKILENYNIEDFSSPLRSAPKLRGNDFFEGILLDEIFS